MWPMQFLCESLKAVRVIFVKLVIICYHFLLNVLVILLIKLHFLKFFRVHMHDLKDVTNNVHYENFRYSHLATVTSEGQKTKPVTTSKYVIMCDI